MIVGDVAAIHGSLARVCKARSVQTSESASQLAPVARTFMGTLESQRDVAAYLYAPR